jgi:hypothetical protein
MELDRHERTSSLSVSLLGRQNSGKTTFLGGLWILVKSTNGDTEYPSLELRGPLPERTAYLDDAAHALLGAERVAHTHRDTGEEVDLAITLGDVAVELDLVDISGETLEAALVTRRAPRVLLERIGSANSVLLFINVAEVRQLFTIAQARRIEREAGSEPPDGVAAATQSDELPDDDEIRRLAPTAIHLVELLQIVLGQSRPPLPVSVVLSAWDIVDPDATPGLPPSEQPSLWLRRYLPLLDQFLATNGDRIPSRIFGLSAQGGDYSDPERVERLAQTPYKDRVIVVDGSEVTRDFSLPLRWLVSAASVS